MKRTWAACESKVVAHRQNWQCANCNEMLPAGFELMPTRQRKNVHSCLQLSGSAALLRCHPRQTAFFKTTKKTQSSRRRQKALNRLEDFKMPLKSKVTKPTAELAYTRLYQKPRAGLRTKAIYIIYSPITSKIVYVGQTYNTEERVKGHLANNSGCTMLAKRIKEWAKKGYAFDATKHLKLVPELPKGVPASRANEFECFFIAEHRTVFHPMDTPECCNQTIGNHASTVNFDNCRIDLTNDTVFPKCDDHTFAADAAKASLETVEAITMLEEDDEYDEEVPAMVEVRQNLQTAIIAATKVCDELLVGAFNYIEAEYLKLAGRTGEMPRSEIQTVLNIFKEKVAIEISNDARGADEDILRMIKDFNLFASSNDQKRQAPIQVRSARSFLDILVSELEAREILAMQRFYAGVMSSDRKAAGKGGSEPTSVINVLVEYLHWLNTYGDKPRRHSYDDKERNLGNHFNNWKRQWNKPLEVKARWLFRHYPMVLVWMDVSGTVSKGAENAKKANLLLLQGHKHYKEPFAEGKTFPSTGDNKPVWAKMNNLVYGSGCKEDLEILIADLPKERAVWYRNEWVSKEQAAKAKYTIKNNLRRKRQEEATGKTVIRKSRKNRKVEETKEVVKTGEVDKVEVGEGSSSAETNEEDGEDSDENSDEDSDEDSGEDSN